jgi:hypothetical protein
MIDAILKFIRTVMLILLILLAFGILDFISNPLKYIRR